MAYDSFSTVLTAVINRSASWETTLATNWENISPDNRELLKTLTSRTVNNAESSEVFTALDTLTAAETGKTCYLNAAGGFTITLPAAAAGLKFKFVVKTNPTTAYIILAGTADTIVGWPVNIGGADSVADGNALGDQLNFAANVALAGDFAEFESDGTYWYVHAHSKAINAITITG